MAPKVQTARASMLDGVRELPIDAGEPRGMVGDHIRRLRRARSMTLEALSEATGLSTGHLSQIERDLSSPTLKAMFDISKALGVSVGWFLKEDGTGRDNEGKYVLRPEQRKEISFATGIRDLLLNTSAVKSLEVLLSTLAPGASVSESYSHEGEECGLILSGQLELWIDNEMFILNQNDSFSFPSAKMHCYRNPGITETVVVWCITPPSY